MTHTIKKLETQIKRANWKYWVKNNPDISDFKYDKLIEELRSLDPNNRLINAFTFKGTEKKVIHSKPMLSLAKAYSVAEIMKWAKKYARSKDEKFIIMPKYDGLSGKFENGLLSSRGDGRTGQDYTDRLKLIKFLTLAQHKDILLGEMLITNDDFKNIYSKLKSKSGVEFKNQRNAASGIIGCDDVDFYVKQGAKITFIDYDYHQWFTTYEKLEQDWTEIVKQIQQLPYPMDGIVVKLADSKYYDSLGANSHDPYGAIAFKYTNTSKWTKLIGVEWSMGKDQIACIGKVEPIEITGTTIKNVKLQLTEPVASNVETYLLNNSLQIGDYVLVERAGDIIPHVAESKPGEKRTPVVLERCPFCGGELEITKTSVKCTNPKCDEKIIQGLAYGMRVLEFKGVGDAYVRNLHELLGVNNILDLMNVTIKDLHKYREFGDKMADIFIAQQEKAKHTTKAKFLTSLNLNGLGNFISKVLLDNFAFDKIISGKITYSNLIAIPGVGPISAKDVSESLSTNVKYVNDALAKFELAEVISVKKDATAGKICFTGKMEHTRGEMESIASKHGFTPVDHVDKETNYLVCADPNSNSGKMQKARKLGCKVISEKEFYEMIK